MMPKVGFVLFSLASSSTVTIHLGKALDKAGGSINQQHCAKMQHERWSMCVSSMHAAANTKQHMHNLVAVYDHFQTYSEILSPQDIQHNVRNCRLH